MTEGAAKPKLEIRRSPTVRQAASDGGIADGEGGQVGKLRAKGCWKCASEVCIGHCEGLKGGDRSQNIAPLLGDVAQPCTRP